MPSDADGHNNDGSVRQFRFQPAPGSTTVLLVRHGESLPAHPDRPFPVVDGHGDPPLDPVGHAQAQRLAARLDCEHLDAIYVTTLCRTLQTAQPLAERLGITPLVEPDLREVHLGEWEGGEFRLRAAAGDPLFERLHREERWDVIPGAEPLEDFDSRCARGLARIVANHPDQRVMVVAHGGVIGQLLHQVTGARRFAFTPDNASISEIVVHPLRTVMRRFNDVAHLEG
jgi:2,3-bisphosphoglycerate-dependent phosphoglycerate mutase